MSVTKKTLMVGGVAVATLGLSTCIDGGAVDPAPGPLDCNAVGKGQRFNATGTLVDTELKIDIITGDGRWKEAPQVSNVTGATLTNITFDSADSGLVTVVLGVDPTTATSGSFTISGTLTGYEGETCPATRTFNFTLGDGGVTVASRDHALPLGTRDRAAIVVTRREGREVVLHAKGAPANAAIGWTATAGAIDAHGKDGATWRLPEEPGLYQIELLVDRGKEGLSIDTLTLEVG